MKIAICLSGQPRSVKYAAPSIINYFSGNYQVDYFCHSWNYNTWKYKTDRICWDDDEIIDDSELRKNLSIFNSPKVLIHSKNQISNCGHWESLFYSIMMVNNLKKQFEIENNFRYDLVIRARYDAIYNPGTKFISPEIVDDLDIYTMHFERMNIEYNRRNVSDVFFFGTSYGMDILCDAYRYLLIKNKQKRLDDYDTLGPGVIIGDYCDRHNLLVRGYSGQEIIYRKEMMPLDPIKNFDTILENHMGYYR